MALFNIPKTEREIKYRQLSYTKVPEILEEYDKLRNGIVNDDPEYMKIGGECLEYLYTDEDVDVTCDIEDLDKWFNVYDEICYKIDQFTFHVSNAIRDISSQCLKDKKKQIDKIVSIIQSKYIQLIESKHLTRSSVKVYFSKAELVTVAEICELLAVLDEIVDETSCVPYSICEKIELILNEYPQKENIDSIKYDDYDFFSILNIPEIIWKLEGIFGTKEELRNAANL